MTHSASRPLRVESRNATFQHWETLLRNRTKRHRAGEFVVQGVRPISLAIEHNWEIRALLRPMDARPSAWAQRTWDGTPCDHVELPTELLAELGERDQDAPELVAVVGMPSDDLARLDTSSVPLIVVFDRPSQPGNIGTLLRSIDAFGGTGLVVTGHAADPYDSKAVRASTGSIFAVPTVRMDAPGDFVRWARDRGIQVYGTHEGGESRLRTVDFTGPSAIVIGNETRGLSRAWADACDAMVSIAMVGAASSLNAATAGSIVLHEALTQRLG